MKSITIDFVSDIACPWCAVGLCALEQAIERVKDEVQVQLRFQPFELNPQMGPEGESSAEHLKRKYGMSDEQLAQAKENLRQRGLSVGFHFGLRPRIVNTFDAHRLLHWAGLQDRQHALKRTLLQAYQAEDRDVSDRQVLIDCAQAAGLDAPSAAQVLQEGRYAEDVRQQEQRWQASGIHSVPSIIFNDRHLLQGGQPVEVFEQALRELSA